MQRNRTGGIANAIIGRTGGTPQAPGTPQGMQPTQQQGQTLSQMLGGSIYAQQMGDDSMNPLALIRQYRETGQLPTGMQAPNVMMGRMPVGQMGEVAPVAGGQPMAGKGLK